MVFLTNIFYYHGVKMPNIPKSTKPLFSGLCLAGLTPDFNADHQLLMI